ncbi:MAG: Ppx/GppA family phosphatase [Nocardioides sp.]|jgi:exopolyphosphatase/guanosine-5'-triphosphate,3'-diphosphate pyrophosphatase|uniref:Ppx/GppA phosphatase family protein n=1 Tax=Nocardioides sp. TaxID=35761 RepID=UPI00262CFA38|nr:exopolyphosphatase [Nocardioides sp.]MCW2833130.1 Ppx/GppA family phosphatase [Nocardioides sp.]
MTTVAAIDCGTNTIKLLIGTHTDTGLEVAVRESAMVRLGQGVDATGRIHEEALVRAFAAIDTYAEQIGQHHVDRIRFCATSATRDASNAAEFRAGVLFRLGVQPEVLSGEEEAAVAFAGAMSNISDDARRPVLVIDIGGGSTEVVLGDDTAPGHDTLLASESMDIGSVRLHERHVRHDPATREEIGAVVRDVDDQLDACGVDLAAAATAVGIAGTMTTIAAGVLDLATYDPEAIDRSVHRVDDVHAYVERLVSLTVAERLALGYMHPGRADVIDAGALIASRVLRRTNVESLLVSEADILEGIAWSMRP